MKYVASFATFDSAEACQGDFISLKENRQVVHGWRGSDWVDASTQEVREIVENLCAIARVDKYRFYAEVELDSSTGAVTKRWLNCIDSSQSGCGGYGYSKTA